MRFLQENCPFAHDRDFRAILFSSPHLEHFDDVNRILFASELTRGEGHRGSTATFSVEHRFYFSRADYTSNERDRRACYGKSGRKGSYRYSIFLAQVAVAKLNRFLIIVPLMKMARAIYPEIQQRSLGSNVSYWKIELPGLIEKVRSGKHLEGRIALRRIRYDLVGDPKGSSLILGGDDVPNCVSLKRIEGALSAEGVRQKPKSVRLLLRERDSGRRFHLSIDSVGHLKFFVDEGAENFPLLGTILKYLGSHGLIQSAGFPSFRRTDDQPQGQEEHDEE